MTNDVNQQQRINEIMSSELEWVHGVLLAVTRDIDRLYQRCDLGGLPSEHSNAKASSESSKIVRARLKDGEDD